MQLNLPKTKEAFEIIKSRWREVVFIIALGVLSMSINMTQIVFHPTGNLLRILITLVTLTFTIIIFMLIIGFQRTVYTEERKRQSLLVLLREGKRFVLRLVGLALIYFLALACLQILVLLAIKHAAPNIMDARWGASLVYRLPSTSVSLILMKLLLLIFPLIIVLDCDIFVSFKMLGQCRLRDARELVILFLISLGLPFLWDLLPSVSFRHGMTISYYLLTTAPVIVGQFIDLMAVVMAVRFVASRNLVYDNRPIPVDSQTLLKP